MSRAVPWRTKADTKAASGAGAVIAARTASSLSAGGTMGRLQSAALHTRGLHPTSLAGFERVASGAARQLPVATSLGPLTPLADSADHDEQSDEAARSQTDCDRSQSDRGV